MAETAETTEVENWKLMRELVTALVMSISGLAFVLTRIFAPEIGVVTAMAPAVLAVACLVGLDVLDTVREFVVERRDRVVDEPDVATDGGEA